MSVSPEKLKEDIAKILNAPRFESSGLEVPRASDIAHCGGYQRLDATVLFADLADSTGLLGAVTPNVAAAIIQSFLKMCARMIDHTQGSIRAFDGDRVMAIFVAPHGEARAVRCALHIEWGMQSIVAPMLRAHFGIAIPSSVVLRQGVGVDSSQLLAVRAGNRDAHDVVWVGAAANRAAKMSAWRDATLRSWVSEAVFNALPPELKADTAKAIAWERREWKLDPAKPTVVYASGSAIPI